MIQALEDPTKNGVTMNLLKEVVDLCSPLPTQSVHLDSKYWQTSRPKESAVVLLAKLGSSKVLLLGKYRQMAVYDADSYQLLGEGKLPYSYEKDQ